jgi:hypothetical protein
MARRVTRPQAKTLALIAEVNGILGEYDCAVTLRQLFYRLVARLVLPNTRAAYQSLSSHLTSARAAGLVDARRIVDHVRGTIRVGCWESPAELLHAAVTQYRREKWATQPHHVEVWCEKDAVVSVLRPVTDALEVTLYPCRGYSSFSALLEAADRLRSAMAFGRSPRVIYLGDFDPSGQDMPRDIRDRLAGDYDIDVALEVVALTRDQIEEHGLPRMMTKGSDSRAARFVESNGDIAVELDALPPDVLADLTRASVLRFLDKSAFRREQEQEERDRDRLSSVLDACAGMM